MAVRTLLWSVESNGLTVGLDDAHCITLSRHYPDGSDVVWTVSNVAGLCEALQEAKAYRTELESDWGE